MALQCDPPHLGDIGDHEFDREPDDEPDSVYEQQIEKQHNERTENNE